MNVAVGSYIHNSTHAAVLRLQCSTDLLARSLVFRERANLLARHLVTLDPEEPWSFLETVPEPEIGLPVQPVERTLVEWESEFNEAVAVLDWCLMSGSSLVRLPSSLVGQTTA